MRVTATEAKNRFGSLCAQAKRAPVFVEKAGQIDTVMLSAEHYEALRTAHEKPVLTSRKKAFEARQMAFPMSLLCRATFWTLLQRG